MAPRTGAPNGLSCKATLGSEDDGCDFDAR